MGDMADWVNDDTPDPDCNDERQEQMSSYTIESTEALMESDSGKALLIEAEDFDEPQWIPHSQITADSEVYKVGTGGNLLVSNWFAEKRGWV